MKEFSVSFIFLWMVCFTGLGKADSTYLSPSFYYTNGSYSGGSVSNSLAFYNTLQIFDGVYLINNYDNLKIQSRDWDYLQQTFLAGTFVDLFPLYLKFNYVHYKGDFNYLPFPYEYSDFTNLYSADAFYYTNGFYVGAAYMHLNQSGFKKQIVNQVTLRLEKILSNNFFISLKPSYSHLLDGRKLFSASLKLHFLVCPDLLLKFGGFAGERAYYFDTDLLTIFNQDETQKYLVFAQAEYNLIRELGFTFAYLHTKFNTFEINYFVGGIKVSLYL